MRLRWDEYGPWPRPKQSPSSCLRAFVEFKARNNAVVFLALCAGALWEPRLPAGGGKHVLRVPRQGVLVGGGDVAAAAAAEHYHHLRHRHPSHSQHHGDDCVPLLPAGAHEPATPATPRRRVRANSVSGEWGRPPPPLPRACAVDCRQGWRKLHVLAPSILTTWPPSPVPLPSSLRVSTSLHLYACVCL